MIKKLMKRDICQMSRILIYIYGISLLLAGLTRVINIWSNIQFIRIIGDVFAGFTYSAVASILINNFVHILRVFISSFYKDESYLTHTLPVKKEELLLSKYLSSLIVTFSSFVVSFLSLFIVLYSKDLFANLKLIFEASFSGFSLPTWFVLTLILLIILFEICTIITITFCAVIKANTYNSNRIFKGLVWFFIYYFASVICTLFVAAIVFAISGNLSQLLASQLNQQSFIILLIIALISYIIYNIVFYFISRKFFKKGVNVD